MSPEEERQYVRMVGASEASIQTETLRQIEHEILTAQAAMAAGLPLGKMAPHVGPLVGSQTTATMAEEDISEHPTGFSPMVHDGDHPAAELALMMLREDQRPRLTHALEAYRSFECRAGIENEITVRGDEGQHHTRHTVTLCEDRVRFELGGWGPGHRQLGQVYAHEHLRVRGDFALVEENEDVVRDLLPSLWVTSLMQLLLQLWVPLGYLTWGETCTFMGVKELRWPGTEYRPRRVARAVDRSLTSLSFKLQDKDVHYDTIGLMQIAGPAWMSMRMLHLTAIRGFYRRTCDLPYLPGWTPSGSRELCERQMRLLNAERPQLPNVIEAFYKTFTDSLRRRL